jgi:N-acetylneuraminic acid mutarotase
VTEACAVRARSAALLAAVGAAVALALPGNAGAQGAPPGAWEVRADIPYRVQEIYPALHQGRIYLAGGLSPDVDAAQQGVSDRVYVYDPAIDRWEPGPSLPEPRHHPYLVSTGSALFAIGGFVVAGGGRWSASRDILRLDEAAGAWVKVAELRAPQSETVAGVIGGKVYIASGRAPTGRANAQWSDQGDVNRLQIFDPATLEVTDGPAAPVRRNSAAGAVIDGRLYVVGGRVVNGGNVTANEAFDPATGTWTTLAPLPNAQGGIAAAAIGDRLYVFGGEYFGRGGGGVYREAWVYDPASDAWSRIADMPLPRHGLGAVTVGDRVFVIAGAARAGAEGTTNRLSAFTP